MQQIVQPPMDRTSILDPCKRYAIHIDRFRIREAVVQSACKSPWFAMSWADK